MTYRRIFWKRFHRRVEAFQPWGIFVAVLALCLAVVEFWIDYGDRVGQREARMWQVLATTTTGTAGKIGALEYLNREDGLFCADILVGRLGWLHKEYPNSRCLILLKPKSLLLGIDLSRATHSRGRGPDAERSGVYLRGIDLFNAELHSALLSGALLKDANLRQANLDKADLANADLRRADLREATLVDALLPDTKLMFIDLRGATATGANLNRAIFDHAQLDGANLLDADLRSASLSAVDFGTAFLQGAILNECPLVRRRSEESFAICRNLSLMVPVATYRLSSHPNAQFHFVLKRKVVVHLFLRRKRWAVQLYQRLDDLRGHSPEYSE